MRVLVTGATGFVGRHAVAALDAAGCEVVAVARRAPAMPLPGRFMAADLLEPGAAAALTRAVGASHLLHLAWEARPGIFWSAPANLDWCARSLDLLRGFADAGGGRAVLAGSVAELRWDGGVVGDHGEPPGPPATLYGIAKDALRRLALGWAGATGLSLAWGRLFWLYGPGEPSGRLVPDLLAAFADGRAAAISSGEQRRDFLHVTDAASAFAAALRHDYRGVFNIGSGRAVAVRALAEQLAELAGARGLLSVGARPDATGEPAEIVADVTTLTTAIGYRPRIALAEGLAALVREARG